MLPPKKYWPDLVFTGSHSKLIFNRDYVNCAELLWSIGVSSRGLDDKVAYYVDGEATTYSDLLLKVNKMGNALRGLGVKEGDRVLFRFGDDIEAVITQLAVWKIGAICVPTQPLDKAPELEYIFNDTECKVVVTLKENIEEVEKALANSPTVKKVIVAGAYEGAKPFIIFDELLEGKSIDLEVARTNPFDVNGIYYTGGTTGRPKGCLCTHAGEVAHALNVVEVRGTQVSDVHYCPLPVGHTFGNFEKVPNIVGGGISTILNKERFSPRLVLETIQKYRVTKLIASPTVLRMISSSINVEDYDLSSLRLLLCSGEFFDKKVFDEWTRILGFEPWNGYGMTPFRGWLINPADRGKKLLVGRAVGQPLPGYEIRVVDKEGNDVRQGEAGALLVRGPTGICFLNNRHPDIDTYVDNDMNWGKYSRADDFFIKNQDGWFDFLVRESALIRSAGRFIDPSEIEEVLRKHPAVKEVVVYASPDSIRGEVPKAAIVLNEGYKNVINLDTDLKDFVKSSVAPYKIPRKFVYLETIPKDAVGKIQRKKLRDIEFEVYNMAPTT